jgi:hypothetical protein
MAISARCRTVPCLKDRDFFNVFEAHVITGFISPNFIRNTEVINKPKSLPYQRLEKLTLNSDPDID